ncbi:hypothetical protein [Haloferula sp.]|uniref:hypothetical protein n=1 Tax=Haloferula sp. TaxID=2497595 RepID=UPI0032A11699
MPTPIARAPRGYVSYVLVLTMGGLLLALLLGTYKTSIRSQEAQTKAGLRIDYAAKEEEVLKSIVNLVPNRAIAAMKTNSNVSSSARDALRWKKLFSQALDQANARDSLDAAVSREFELDDTFEATSGDATYSNILSIFDPIEPDPHSWDVSPGTGRIIGTGYPPSLDSNITSVIDADRKYPIISRSKVYADRAQSGLGALVTDYPEFNLLPYPDIRFGYAEPGQPFVAKRNWWAFSLDLAEDHDHISGLDNYERDFVVSVYEIPSQLAISAEAFTVLGKHADGTDWGSNTSISGGIFATRAKVEAGMNIARISGRRGLDISMDASVGANPIMNAPVAGSVSGSLESFTKAEDPFAPGVREQYELQNDSFMPVSMASESGRAAFVPINRGIDFFDRYAHAAESNTISDTSWNEYSVGAVQCAMHVDITDVMDPDDSSPGELTFRYFKNGWEQSMVIDLKTGPDTDLPSGYIWCASENSTITFDHPVDVAYGKNGEYFFQNDVSGPVTFDNSRFGDPAVGTFKSGFYRPSYPFEVELLHDTKPCVTLYPERFPAFLDLIDADDTSVNHSVSINVDHPGNLFLEKPSIPCTDIDYGVILRECADLSGFPKGFSMVTNLRLYIADDFNNVAVAAPAGSGIPDPFYPPCSLFAPEKRYGAENNPFRLKISGQVGSLAGDGGTAGQSVHLLDMKNASENDVAHDKVEVNLSPITHPAALPPITMMNWLVVLEERRREFYSVSGNQP